jgi:hypothetical protein
MADFSNGAVRRQDPFFGFRPPYNIGQLITFPDISGRDAPGKTGSAAKPALVNGLNIEVTAYNSSNATTKFAMWASDGSNGVYTGVFTLPNAQTPYLVGANLYRTVFANTGYWIGFTKETTAQVTYSVDTNFPASIKMDNTSFDSNFTDNGIVRVGSPAVTLSNGSMVFVITYDILPTAPGTPTASSTGTSATITWTAPADNGGQAVTSYRIQRSTDNINFSTIVASTGTTSLTYTNTGLTPGTKYFYRVAAINAVATSAGSDYSGPYSASVEITPAFPASAGNAPSLLTVTVANPEPTPVEFTDAGPGIRFTKIDVSYGSEFLYNEVEGTTQDPAATLQLASAPGSKRLYGVRSYSITNLLNSTDQGALEVATDLLTYYYEPTLRVDSITVDLSNLSLEQRLQVLDLEIDDYISVSFTPNKVGDPKITAGLITGISHRITITSHEIEFRLRNERNMFILDSATKGILNQNVLGP